MFLRLFPVSRIKCFPGHFNFAFFPTLDKRLHTHIHNYTLFWRERLPGPFLYPMGRTSNSMHHPHSPRPRLGCWLGSFFPFFYLSSSSCREFNGQAVDWVTPLAVAFYHVYSLRETYPPRSLQQHFVTIEISKSQGCVKLGSQVSP